MTRFDDYLNKKVEKHLREKMFQDVSFSTREEKIEFTGQLDLTTGMVTDPNTGNTYTAHFHGTPHSTDSTIKINHEHAIMVRDQDPYTAHDLLGKVWLIYRGPNDISGHTTWWLKDIENDQLYEIDARAIAGIVGEEPEFVNYITEVMFFPLGKHIFAGSIQSTENPQEYMLKFGVLKDFEVSDTPTPSMSGTLVQGTKLLSIENLQRPDAPDTPPTGAGGYSYLQTTTTPTSSSSLAVATNYEVVEDEEINAALNAVVNSVSGAYNVTENLDSELLVDFTGTYSERRTATSVFRIQQVSESGAGGASDTFACFGPFCDGSVHSLNCTSQSSRDVMFNYADVDPEESDISVNINCSSSAFRTGCFPAGGCGGLCGPSSDQGCGGCFSTSSGLNQNVMMPWFPSLATVIIASFPVGSCFPATDPLSSTLNMYTENYNEGFGTFAIQFLLNLGGLDFSMMAHVDMRETTAEDITNNSGGGFETLSYQQRNFNAEITDNDLPTPIFAYGPGIQGNGFRARDTSTSTIIQYDDGYRFASPFNTAGSLIPPTFVTYTNDQVLTFPFAGDPTADRVIPRDSRLFNTYTVLDAEDDEITVKEITQHPTVLTAFTVTGEIKGKRPDPLFYTIMDFVFSR